uniref:non-specific serine/threonine protein kinase n=1 Tax=Lactuca sativa TaxID=4236 RepID=A0A9R1X0E6_LACSA|nr:hypothetical protein LSAT_V11C800441600 [Lactuca sativa]
MVFLEGNGTRTLKLFGTGNVKFMEDASGKTFWQSFNTPTDTFLLGMKLDKSLMLTSWKNLNDPGTGSYLFRLDKGGEQYVIMKDTTYYWKSGNPKNSSDDNAMLPDALSLLSNTTTGDNYSRLVMNYTGHVQYLSWEKASKQWVLEWEAPRDYCSEYHVCGSYGMCNQTNDPQPCRCLTGFQRASRRDPKAGCKRKSEICETTTDTFLNLTLISVDDTDVTFQKSNNESVCIEKCLESCLCVAYAYTSQPEEQLVDESRHDTQGCWFWNSQLYNLKAPGRHNISIRVAAGHQVKGRSEFQKLVVPLAVGVSVLGVIFLCVVVYISYRRLVNRIAEDTRRRIELESNIMSSSVNELPRPDDSREANEYQDGGVQQFNLEEIKEATGNFSQENFLGVGGFGSVYKGELGGRQVAVKRLTSTTGQGQEEFKNEVSVIAKLQHRNLVQLYGYCADGDEMILVYEHMPNKSLDSILFDPNHKASLDWRTRYKIISGITAGLSYMHHDSRVRTIHRDFKTGNILLDEDMNPKISDFGLYKILSGNETGETAKKVSGTPGYIAPEYSENKVFSTKSDVYSYGVVLLEIVSGQRISKLYLSEDCWRNLIAQAWKLWVEGKALELMDPTLMDTCNPHEVLKCINIGLQCVNNQADKRPPMSNVILMLGSEPDTLPNPTDPTDQDSQKDHAIASSSGLPKEEPQFSKNMMDITVVHPR